MTFIVERLHQYAEVADFWMGLGVGFSAGMFTAAAVYIIEGEIRRRHNRRALLAYKERLENVPPPLPPARDA